MRRRDFLRACGASAAGLAVGAGRVRSADEAPRPLTVGTGPQLFLDDYLIDQLTGLARRVESPERLPKPVLDSETFGTTQPYLTVLRDDENERYRVWYNHGPAVWHAESADGLRWAACDKNPVLPSWPEGYPTVTRHGVGDIVDVFWDAPRRRYAAAVKLHALPEDGYAPGPRAGKIFRRLVGLSTSKDFVSWEKPWRIFTP